MHFWTTTCLPESSLTVPCSRVSQNKYTCWKKIAFFFFFLPWSTCIPNRNRTLPKRKNVCYNGINNESQWKNKKKCLCFSDPFINVCKWGIFFSSLHAPNRSAPHRTSLNFYLVERNTIKVVFFPAFVQLRLWFIVFRLLCHMIYISFIESSIATLSWKYPSYNHPSDHDA